jgi:hypothetical protein
VRRDGSTKRRAAAAWRRRRGVRVPQAGRGAPTGTRRWACRSEAAPPESFVDAHGVRSTWRGAAAATRRRCRLRQPARRPDRQACAHRPRTVVGAPWWLLPGAVGASCARAEAQSRRRARRKKRPPLVRHHFGGARTHAVLQAERAQSVRSVSAGAECVSSALSVPACSLVAPLVVLRQLSCCDVTDAGTATPRAALANAVRQSSTVQAGRSSAPTRPAAKQTRCARRTFA